MLFSTLYKICIKSKAKYANVIKYADVYGAENRLAFLAALTSIITSILIFFGSCVLLPYGMETMNTMQMKFQYELKHINVHADHVIEEMDTVSKRYSRQKRQEEPAQNFIPFPIPIEEPNNYGPIGVPSYGTPTSSQNYGGNSGPSGSYGSGPSPSIDQCLCQANKCPAGSPGQPGGPGIDGKDGLPGVDGQPGRDGADDSGNQTEECQLCPEGLPGLAGDNGPPGPVGQKGPQGQQGTPGRPGVDNYQTGPDGSSGPPGRDGNPGPPGRKGDDAPGGKGAKGLRGEPGGPGLQGPPGPPGQNADQLFTGPPGPPGPQGPQGNIGPPGPLGPPGDKGTAGNDARYCPCQDARLTPAPYYPPPLYPYQPSYPAPQPPPVYGGPNTGTGGVGYPQAVGGDGFYGRQLPQPNAFGGPTDFQAAAPPPSPFVERQEQRQDSVVIHRMNDAQKRVNNRKKKTKRRNNTG